MQTKAKTARTRKAKATPAQPLATAATGTTATPASNAPAQPLDSASAPAIVAAPAPATDDSGEIKYRTAQRDAATVAALRTNFAQYSDRDSAYLAFFGSVMRVHNDSATLAQIHAAGTDTGNGKRSNPRYTGSAKATDAGAINRLVKAGYITTSESGNRLHATALAKASALYTGKA